MSNPIRVIIADDHPIVRQGLRYTIEADPQLSVICDVGDGQAALERVEALKPDVVVLDIDMPKMDGLQVARTIVAKRLKVEIIFLTIHSEEDLFHAALDLGAKGYILKDCVIDDVVSCIKAVVNGKYFTSISMTNYLLNRFEPQSPLEPRRRELDLLTPTELRILKLLGDYKTSKEIAADLNISPRTVETHRNNICQKLDLHGSHALVKFAIQNRKKF